MSRDDKRSDLIINRCTEHHRCNEADVSVTASRSSAQHQMSAYGKIHGKIPKKILLKFEEHAVPTIPVAFLYICGF